MFHVSMHLTMWHMGIVSSVSISVSGFDIFYNSWCQQLKYVTYSSIYDMVRVNEKSRHAITAFLWHQRSKVHVLFSDLWSLLSELDYSMDKDRAIMWLPPSPYKVMSELGHHGPLLCCFIISWWQGFTIVLIITVWAIKAHLESPFESFVM